MTKTKRDPSAYAVASLLLILPSLLRGIAEAYIAFAGLSAEYSDRDMFVYPFGGTEDGVTTLLNILPAMCLVAGAALAAAAVIRGRAGGRLSSLVLSLLTVCCATATWVASLIVMYNDDLIMVIPALVACGFYAACCILTFVGKGWAPGGAFTAVLGVAAACAFVLPTQFGIPLAWACMWYGVAGALRAFFGKRVGDIAEYASAALMLAGPMTVGIMCFVQAWGVPIAYLAAVICCALTGVVYYLVRLTPFGRKLCGHIPDAVVGADDISAHAYESDVKICSECPVVPSFAAYAPAGEQTAPVFAERAHEAAPRKTHTAGKTSMTRDDKYFMTVATVALVLLFLPLCGFAMSLNIFTTNYFELLVVSLSLAGLSVIVYALMWISRARLSGKRLLYTIGTESVVLSAVASNILGIMGSYSVPATAPALGALAVLLVAALLPSFAYMQDRFGKDEPLGMHSAFAVFMGCLAFGSMISESVAIFVSAAYMLFATDIVVTYVLGRRAAIYEHIVVALAAAGAFVPAIFSAMDGADYGNILYTYEDAYDIVPYADEIVTVLSAVYLCIVSVLAIAYYMERFGGIFSGSRTGSFFAGLRDRTFGISPYSSRYLRGRGYTGAATRDERDRALNPLVHTTSETNEDAFFPRQIQTTERRCENVRSK